MPKREKLSDKLNSSNDFELREGAFDVDKWDDHLWARIEEHDIINGKAKHTKSQGAINKQ